MEGICGRLVCCYRGVLGGLYVGMGGICGYYE